MINCITKASCKKTKPVGQRAILTGKSSAQRWQHALISISIWICQSHKPAMPGCTLLYKKNSLLFSNKKWQQRKMQLIAADWWQLWWGSCNQIKKILFLCPYYQNTISWHYDFGLLVKGCHKLGSMQKKKQPPVCTAMRNSSMYFGPESR